jgi:hypothetical protein
MSQILFEIGVFNAAVRRAVAEGERHRDLTDDWADIHYLEVRADDVDGAKAKIEKRYPAARGFVVTEVRRLG